MRGFSKRWALPGLLALLPLAACAPSISTNTGKSATPAAPTATLGADETIGYTPQQLRDIYGVTPLINAGITGKGVTVAVIESYGSPTIQQDVDAFDQKFGLPALHVQIESPLGTVPFDPNNSEMAGPSSWQGETSIDVEIIHAIAPDAQIVVMTSPVDETEGVQGLPQFLQLEQDVVNNHLATIVSQSFGASEYTLKDAAGQQELAQWDSFYHQATTQDGMTFFASSGDNGATDLASTDINARPLVPTRTVGFPADDPWVTAVGGTAVWSNGNGTYNRIAWGGNIATENESGSEGGFSAFFAQPSYQSGLPAAMQSQANGKRGLPDIAAAADPRTGLVCVIAGQESVAGGTSASAPLWAGIAALAEQKAGHPLGFINPALYKLAEGKAYGQDFYDIIAGTNTTYNNGQVYVQGYNAGAGWDPVTGWGEANAAHLVPDLLSALG